MLLDFKKWHPSFSEKHMKTFFWMSYQKNVFMIFVEKFCRESYKTFRTSLVKLGQKSFAPPKICLS